MVYPRYLGNQQDSIGGHSHSRILSCLCRQLARAYSDKRETNLKMLALGVALSAELALEIELLAVPSHDGEPPESV
jgi:hypothetical protein